MRLFYKNLSKLKINFQKHNLLAEGLNNYAELIKCTYNHVRVIVLLLLCSPCNFTLGVIKLTHDDDAPVRGGLHAYQCKLV